MADTLINSETKTITRRSLKLTYLENADSLVLSWDGKSNERNPGDFLTPILHEILDKSNTLNKKIILDFQAMEYMNSSSISPISKLVDKVRNNSNSISVIYQKSKKWQELCFSALKIFETPDKRIEIVGK